MIRILKGDATNVSGRNLTMTLPPIDISPGYTLSLEFLGIEKELGDVTEQNLIWNYTSEQTACMPLGIHFAILRLKKTNGDVQLVQTVSNTIPIEVSDCVSEVYGEEPSVNANITIRGGIPEINIDELTRADTAGDIKTAFNELLAILKNAS